VRSFAVFKQSKFEFLCLLIAQLLCLIYQLQVIESLELRTLFFVGQH
jgi:hypothetical protein